MQERPLLAALALTFAITVSWVAFQDWHYLQRGYSLAIALGDDPASLHHIDFPAWRKAVHAMTYAATISVILMITLNKRYAVIMAWSLFVLALVIGVLDVREYGTLGSPTSILGLLLPFALALLSQARARTPI